MDIFYEPYEGVIMHGGSELGTGIAKVCNFLARPSGYQPRHAREQLVS